MLRTVMFLRHGEAAPAAGSPDRDRPLTAHGAAQAERTGAWIGRGPDPVDAVLCSPALRTRQTLDGAARGAGWADGSPPVSYAQALYNAGAEDVLDEVALTDDAVRTLLVVGHFPGLPEAALTLDPAGPHSGVVRRGMPTGTCVVVATDEPWSALPDAARGASDPFGVVSAVFTP